MEKTKKEGERGGKGCLLEANFERQLDETS